MPHLRREGTVFVLDLGEPGHVDTDNRFTSESMDQIHSLLDEVDASTGPAALVTTASGKIYHNGFIAEKFFEPGSEEYLLTAQRLFTRVLTSELPTIAAVPGHMFAGGAIFAMAHDFRLMREDRGFFCLPEMDLGVSIPAGMSDLLQSRLPAQTVHKAVIAGHRFAAKEALSAGIIDQALPLESILPSALAMGESLASKRSPLLSSTKKYMYAKAVESLKTIVFPHPLEKK